MVIAGAEPELFVVGVDALADDARRGEIERCAGHGCELTRGDQTGGDGRIAVSANLEFVVKNCALAGAAEVEVTVVGQIDRRRGSVRRGGVIDPQALVGRERVGDLDREIPGVAFLPAGLA